MHCQGPFSWHAYNFNTNILNSNTHITLALSSQDENKKKTNLSGMLGPPVEFEEGGKEISLESGGANSQISITFALCFTEYHILTRF